MELRSGLKETRLGVLPNAWSVRSLADVAERIMVGIASAATHAYSDRGIPLLRNQNIKAGHLDDSEVIFVSPDYEKAFRNKRLRAGDLLTARTGYPGITCVVPARYHNAQSFTTLITRPKTAAIDSWYLAACINSDGGKRFFDQGEAGGAQKNVNAGTLRRMLVPVPPMAEQRAIAQALSDVDALLEGLERLIAKKRDLVQAAMQQLLNGRTRLPGFNTEWEVRRLGDVLTICHGKSQRDIVVADGPYPVLASGGKIGTASRPLYEKPSVLIGRKGTIDRPQYMETPFWTVDTLFYSAMKGGNHAKFFYYRFRMIHWMQFNEASGVPSLTARTIENIAFACPEPTEQIAIAGVLADVDAEVAALEARRDKTRALKLAMMQELLTGRTRLV